MTTMQYIQFIMQNTIMFILYFGGGLIAILLLYIKDTHIEWDQEREQSKREMEAQDEHNRIGFLLKLRDERKERV